MYQALVTTQDLRLTLPSSVGTVDILKGIDLELKTGEVVAVVGPSGSGKTSLLMVLAGLEAPTSGTVTIAGQSLGPMDEDALAKLRRETVGIVFQNFHLVPTMSALENVALPLEFARFGDAYGQAEESLKAVGLGHRLHHYPSQLSGGEQQRVGLARAFVHRPKLLLADEPTGNLDGETGAKIVDALMALSREQGTTLLLITHDPAIAALCDRVLTMSAGKLSEGQAA